MADKAVGGRNSAHAPRVLLYWWTSDCGQYHRKNHAVHWGIAPPRPQEITFECLGTMNHHSHTFSVEGVIPLSKMPVMTPEEKLYLMEILRECLAAQTGWRVLGPRRGVVDWIGE